MWNSNIRGLNNCLIESRLGPLVIGFLNIFWEKKKIKKPGLILVKSLSVFFEKFKERQEFFFLIDNIKERICSFAAKKLFFFLKNLVNLFWGKFEKLKFLLEDFQLFFNSEKVPLSIFNVNKVFEELLTYGIKRNFNSFFYSNKNFLIKLTNPYKLHGKLHFFFKILLNFPRLLLKHGISALKKIRLEFFLKRLRKKVFIFFNNNFSKFSNRVFPLLLKNSICSNLFFLNWHSLRSSTKYYNRMFKEHEDESFYNDQFFLKNWFPLFSNFSEKKFNKNFFLNKILSLYLKFDYFFFHTLKISSFFYIFFFFFLFKFFG